MRQLALDIMSCVPSRSAAERVAYLYAESPQALVGVSPADFPCATTYLKAAQEAALVRKLPNIFTSQSKKLKEKAVLTFFHCEEQCKLTNDRLLYWLDYLRTGYVERNEFWEEHHQMESILRRIQKRIKTILGPLPGELVPKFSGGSSLLNVARASTLPEKLQGTCAVTQNLSDIFPLLLKDYIWSDFIFENGISTVRGNRFETVPKDSEKDRGIGVEPLGNLCFQLSVGKHIRSRLKRYDIDIQNKDQSPFRGQSLHRTMARFASIDNDFCTIDLSNASDTVSWALVKLLLPPPWFDVLNVLRSPETYIENRWVKLHKFSSMGNGYTFELETLLFYAISTSVCGHDVVTCYGDDIILPSEDYDGVTSALQFFGFTVNKLKSFKDGPFRESCGGDFFLGADVRPVFLKKSPANPLEWITFQNRLFEIQSLQNWDLATPIKNVINSVPSWARVFGRPGTPGCFWTDDRHLWNTKVKDGMLFQRVILPLPTYYIGWRNKKEALACALLGVPSRGAARRTASGWRRAWVSVS